MWWFGFYIQDAVAIAVEKNLAGRKAKGKYFEKPLLQEVAEKQEEQKKVLSEEEKMKQVEMLFQTLQIRQANFELEKQRKLMMSGEEQ